MSINVTMSASPDGRGLIAPNYGSVISAGPPILAGLAQSSSKALLVPIIYLIVNQIEGDLILPLILARPSTCIPPWS